MTPRQANKMGQMISMQYPADYRILIKGFLDTSWEDRLGGMKITPAPGKDSPGMTTLEGRLPDQAALTGIINTLYDLGFPLLSVECLQANQSETR